MYSKQRKKEIFVAGFGPIFIVAPIIIVEHIWFDLAWVIISFKLIRLFLYGENNES